MQVCFFNLFNKFIHFICNSFQVLGAYQKIIFEKNPKHLQDLEFWEEYGCAKVVLKVNSKEELLDLDSKAKNIGLNTCVIHDAGRTQVKFFYNFYTEYFGLD